ncbi:serine protease inhibitor Kazal-type 10-like [Grus americana]|uniref:serine protease inhibitor Kazal-type 10-like n=1 Tax=Grus americana TaxID=9117 RepID=UPI0024084F49|nr:serine protease inhibitor Kazal-type 10-like [Grus americana]XP_054697882.1 serine protease inhibitor Kazal-type 10-like [Grus americana]
MKTTRSVALLGLVLLSCLSDIVVAQQRASCSTYGLSGKTQLACPRNYEPVCGTDNMTYPNECSLCKAIFRNRAIDKKHDGRCVGLDCTGYLRSSSGRAVPCTLEYNPICGTNGVTYRNKCTFCNAVANGLDLNLRNFGQCFQDGGSFYRSPAPAWNPPRRRQPFTNFPNQIDCNEQKGNNLICTNEYNPLCGSDGRTYGNKCQFCSAVLRSRGNLFLRYHGEC